MTFEAQATAPHKERDGARRAHLLEIVDAMQSNHCEDSVRMARLFFGKAGGEQISLAEFSDALEAMTQRLWGIKALLHGFDEDLDGNPLFDGAHQLVVDVAHEMERIAEAFASEIAAQTPREAGLSVHAREGRRRSAGRRGVRGLQARPRPYRRLEG